MRASAPRMFSRSVALALCGLMAGCFAANPDWEPPADSGGSSGAESSTESATLESATLESATASSGDTSDGSGLECVDITDYLHSSAPDIMLVLDRSGSMVQEQWDGDNEQVTRWSSLYDAMGVALAAINDDARLGLVMFPGDGALNTYSAPGCIMNDEPDVALGVDQKAKILDSLPVPGLEDDKVQGGTPASEAIRLAREHLVEHQSGQLQFIVYVTDGVANCGGECTALPEGDREYCWFDEYDDHIVEEVSGALALGIPTMVIGVQVSDVTSPTTKDGNPDDVNPHDALTEVAFAGGVADIMGEGFLEAHDQDELFLHLNFLTEFITPCHLAPSPDLPIDAVMEGTVEVTLDGQPLIQLDPDSCFAGAPGAAGWAWIDEQHGSAVLCGPSCLSYQSGATLEVNYCTQP
ncbi:MAG: VWA domain-containing protein [Myxococcales bacterium]|nr:VWA domain-containing protein [Myxococcales bacterium]MCB9750378.1 VWA domain-containing protein [Myxococcales bacterium]